MSEMRNIFPMLSQGNIFFIILGMMKNQPKLDNLKSHQPENKKFPDLSKPQNPDFSVKISKGREVSFDQESQGGGIPSAQREVEEMKVVATKDFTIFNAPVWLQMAQAAKCDIENSGISSKEVGSNFKQSDQGNTAFLENL